MRIFLAPVLVAGLGLLLASGQSYAQTQPCPADSGCIGVSVTAPSATFSNNQVVDPPIVINYAQGMAAHNPPLNNEAAIAFSLAIPSLKLSSCDGITDDGLTNAIVPDPDVATNFRVVVENTCCKTGKPCLCPNNASCPDGGDNQTLASYMNIVVFGPKDLPTPGQGEVTFPILPHGSAAPTEGALLSVSLTVNNPPSTPLTLHLFNQTDNQGTTPKPQFGALASVGNTDAKDDTCTGTPPCSGGATSNIIFTDGSLTVVPSAGNGCVGDCDMNCVVDIVDLQKGLNRFFGAAPDTCPAYPEDTVSIVDLQNALNNFFLGACPSPCTPAQ